MDQIGDMVAGITSWMTDLAGSPLLFPALFLLTVGDAFLVILPSETVVVALGAISVATGAPPIVPLLLVAAVAAMTGDVLCFLIGRFVGVSRFRWMRGPRVSGAIERAGQALHRRAAVAILTARYIPFARIAVNLAAGASGLPMRRYLPLTAMAGVAWALYNVGIGALFGGILPGQPIVAVLVSVAVAVTVGLVIDRIGAAADRRRARIQESERLG
ncbi:DedA family protein [Plantibacter sp. Mn2098]|uniref:DedA family protein n=1 Tax=Plantibacter sp. Mn2098 TaxID=3395266 RepID=UPI003BDD47D0